MGLFPSSLRGAPAAPTPAPNSPSRQQLLDGGTEVQGSSGTRPLARRRAQPISLLDGSLTDDLLLLILEKLSLNERHYGPAQACTRLHRLCHTSHLLRDVSVDLRVETLPPFYSWPLRRAAPHIRSLFLHTCMLLEGQGHAEMSQGHQLMGACPSALSAATGLQDLTLRNCFATRFSPAGWPAALPSLRRLELDCPSQLRLDGPPGIMQLTGLRELSVRAQLIDILEDELPLGLTRLQWEGDVEIEPPPQFTALTGLQSLTLRSCSFVAEPELDSEYSYPRAVGDLPAAMLRHACFDDTELPATVSALTRLEALHFYCPETQHGVALTDLLAAVLPSLRYLTALALADVPISRQVMQALGTLPRLKRLAYCDAATAHQQPPDLPAGPWLGRLTLLGLESSALVLNPQLVSGATQLRMLALLGPCWEGSLQPHLRRTTQAAAMYLLHSAAGLRHITSIELHPSWAANTNCVGPATGLLHRLLLAQGLQQVLEHRRPLRCHFEPPAGSQQAPSLKPLMAQLFGPEWA